MCIRCDKLTEKVTNFALKVYLRPFYTFNAYGYKLSACFSQVLWVKKDIFPVTTNLVLNS